MAQGAASFAALQHQRRTAATGYFDGLDLDLTSRLGQSAREGSLALFIGAGTSMPAGAPSWDGLIDALAKKAEIGEILRERLKGLSPLDQAELLHGRLEERLGQTIAKQVRGLKPALAHGLLAGLNCEGAVTTNYDQLYEAAVEGTGDPAVTVLPKRVPGPGGRWLLKMHGDLEDEERIVLTRSQFVGFTGVSGPAGAVLQSLLLTKHLLVVGASMKDDNFLRLIHEVAAYRDPVPKSQSKSTSNGGQAESEKFGTILSFDGDPALKELHGRYFAWETIAGADDAEKARQLEIFLDAVAMFASSDHRWLVDWRFAYLLSEDHRKLAERVRSLADDVRRASEDDNARHAGRTSQDDNPWMALAAELSRFGATSDDDGAQ